MENTLLTEIMVLREKNAELVEMLKRAKERLYTVESPSTSCRFLADEIESLINSNVTE